MMHDDINSIHELEKLMTRLGSKDNKVRMVTIVFGRAYITTYDSPSQVPSNVISACNIDYRGYWKQGKLHKFSKKKMDQYGDWVYDGAGRT